MSVQKFMAIHLADAEISLSISENSDLAVVQELKSGCHQSH